VGKCYTEFGHSRNTEGGNSINCSRRTRKVQGGDLPSEFGQVQLEFAWKGVGKEEARAFLAEGTTWSRLCREVYIVWLSSAMHGEITESVIGKMEEK
jgi:hypothetical protein